MKRQFVYFFISAVLAWGFVSCGGDSEDDGDVAAQPQTQTPTTTEQPEIQRVDVDFEVEEALLQGVFTNHADAIVTKDTDEIASYWLKSESQDVFTAWTFWAGAFEKNVGWKGIKNGWDGIFRLHSGNMTVDITSVAIDAKAKVATLRGSYKWAVSGDFIAAMQKDKDEWKIRAIDYTNAKFGKQIEELKAPAYTNPA